MILNDKQQEIINTVKGAVLVSAPVGTGKTTVLTERVVKAIEAGVSPEEILCLTFTNRAAEEMSTRIAGAVNSASVADLITIKTFHGFCAYLIKAEAKELGISTDFVIFDETEQMEIMKKILSDYPSVFQETDERSALDVLQRIYEYRLYKLELAIGCVLPEVTISDMYLEISRRYLQELANQNALDFNEIVLRTIAALHQNEAVRKKWLNRYSFIQVDEFQDTHLSEYLVIKELAKKSGNILFIGDLDQTIYGWRGSEPARIVKWFKKHFDPVIEFFLEYNYRFSPQLLAAVSSFLKSLDNPSTKKITAAVTSGVTSGVNAEEHKTVEVFAGYNFNEEVSWVIDTIKKIKTKEPNAGIAVLMRGNKMIGKIADIFAQKSIPYVTADKYQFFRRQEVRDVLACIKLIFNRYDLESAYRIIQRPPKSIGDITLEKIKIEGEACGLKVSDFLQFKNFNMIEPYDRLLSAYKKGRIVVLDTETTGKNTLEDEVIQIYCRELVNGKAGHEFHKYIKNTIPVGISQKVHGLSDEFLREKGGDQAKVLSEMVSFIGDSVVVGHNIQFDLEILLQNCSRKKINFFPADYYDTLDIAKRFVTCENYKLSTLASVLNLDSATHSADDDVMATVGLLSVLVNRLHEGREKRIFLFKQFAPKFIKIANSIHQWQKLVEKKRPPEALEEIWRDSGLDEYYKKDLDKENRLKSFALLKDVFAHQDIKEKPSATAMKELLSFAALNKEVHFVGLEKGSIPIVSVHQVKGLEFEYVFVLGMNEFKFPLYKSDIEEEKRVFYVALTRSKKKVFLSYSRFDEKEKPINKSLFIDCIDSQHISFIS